MKRNLLFLSLVMYLVFNFSLNAQILISGVVDGPLSGGVPKAIELYVYEDIPDLSIYGVGSANNGGGTDGEEFTFPNIKVSEGTFLYLASESIGFNNFFGFSPDYTSSAASINGDDAIELFKNGVVFDIFGTVSGSNSSWNYEDGWAYRVNETGPDGSSLILNNWSFSGPNALDGESTNSTASSPFPIGTYSYNTVTIPDASIATAATSIGSDSFTANWNNSDGATKYFLDVSEQSDFSTFVSGYENIDVGNIDYKLVSALSALTDYYYRVRANNTAGTSGNSNVITLQTTATPVLTTELNFVPTSITKNEGDGTVDLTISITNPDLVSATNANIVLTNGTALDIGNYSTQSISFAAGSSTSKTVTISITDDNEYETTETFVFEIQNVTGGNSANVGSNNQFTLTLNDNDGTGSDYYSGISSSLTGDDLKAALHDLIDDHTGYSYSNAWDILKESDQDPADSNNIILLYTGRSQAKNTNGGGVDDWNREHVWAKSHGGFDTRIPEGTDCHHLRPTDATVNSARGNKDFDYGGTRHSEATDCFTDDDSWEPRDEVKGDVARMIFYMDVRYEGDVAGEMDLEVVDYITDGSSPVHGKLEALLAWHQIDPPDAFEMGRNDVVYDYQGNRNPFIDHPEYVSKIWGTVVLKPVIKDLQRDIFIPTASEDITISANITDNGIITDATLHYTIDNGIEQTVSMTNVGDTYSGVIPSSSTTDGGIVKYWISASDNEANLSTCQEYGFFAGTVNINKIKEVYANGELVYIDAYVRVNGVATVSDGILSTSTFKSFLQDNTGGINIFNFNSSIFSMTKGNRYEIIGKIDQYNGLAQIFLSSGTDLGSEETPTANVVTISEILASPESFEGSLIKVKRCSKVSGDWPPSGSSSYNIEVNDGTGSITLAIYSSTNIDGSTEPTWPMDLVGILGQFDDSTPYTTGYQLTLRSVNDFQPDIVINEIHADPASGLEGDANGDGIRHDSEDEFIEIFNNSNDNFDISGWTISDEVSVRHTFPALTILLSKTCLVVFGGGNPIGTFGSATVQTASSGALGFNNSGDVVTLKSNSDVIDSYSYRGEGGDDQSLTQNPDIIGDFVKHSTIPAASGKLFSPGYFNDGTTPLPVELLLFSASKKNKLVTLNWKTATEVNNYGFEIEKSLDKITWEKVGFVEGYGNSNSTKSYTFTNTKSEFGSVYYRLKQIDTDGKFEYHGPVLVELEDMEERFLLEQNYPNPFNPTTKIKFGFKVQTKAKLKIYNSLGKEVAELFNNTAHANQIYEVEFDSKNLASGIYYYSLISESGIKVKKMLLLK